MGKYKCVASLAGLNSSKEFHVERDKIPIVLNSAEGIMIYCQFTICTFIGVCCVISCCVLRTGGRGKTRPKREYMHAKVLEIPQDSFEYCCDDMGEMVTWMRREESVIIGETQRRQQLGSIYSGDKCIRLSINTQRSPKSAMKACADYPTNPTIQNVIVLHWLDLMNPHLCHSI